MNSSFAQPARGITLIEVLISIGILAIGLSSVVALVPAGRSEAAKAVLYDRAANLAANVLNDAMTFGLTKPSSVDANPPGRQMIVFDSLNTISGGPVWGTLTASTAEGVMKPKGIFAAPQDSSVGGKPLLSGVLQSRDDVVYTQSAVADDPPLNAFSLGSRSFIGRTTSILAITPLGSTGFAPGGIARLTAVVFHNRNLSDSTDIIARGTYDAAAGTITLTGIPAGRQPRGILQPGTAIFFPGLIPPAWCQVSMAATDDSLSPPMAYVTFAGNLPPVGMGGPPQPVEIALDSVGIAERIVTLEGPGPYGQ